MVFFLSSLSGVSVLHNLLHKRTWGLFHPRQCSGAVYVEHWNSLVLSVWYSALWSCLSWGGACLGIFVFSGCHLVQLSNCSGFILGHGHLSFLWEFSMPATCSSLFAWRSREESFRIFLISCFTGHFPCVISYFLSLCFLPFFLDQVAGRLSTLLISTPTPTKTHKT